VLEIACVHLGDRPRRVVPSVVNSYVKAAFSGTHQVKERLYIGFLGGIGYDCSSGATGRLNMLNDLLQALSGAARDKHMKSLTCKTEADAGTKAIFRTHADDQRFFYFGDIGSKSWERHEILTILL